VPWYLDTSAAVRLVGEERESDALRRWLATAGPDLVSSDLLVTELLRASRRLGESRLSAARDVIAAVDIVPMARRTFADAGTLDPARLRSLDALHLVCALGLRDELDGIITYDERLLDGAAFHGLAVAAPGR
jgi:predicted nucleic acid-binding protein